MGTVVSTASSVQPSWKLSVTESVDIPDVASAKLTESGTFTDTESEANSQTMSKSQSYDVKDSASADGINHDDDAFLLWVNPAVAFLEDQEVSGRTCTNVNTLNWFLALPPNQPPLNVHLYTIYVRWLKNPSTMPGNVAMQLKQLGFNDNDYNAILSFDPFAMGSTAIDETRFIPTLNSFPYEPYKNCLVMSPTFKNSFEEEHEAGTKKDYKVGFTAELGGIGVGPL
jgi:hypothetical protein